jgi:hypothetical protein
MHHSHEKGANMTHPECSSKTPRGATGLFATLRASFTRTKGSGAPSHRRARPRRPALAALTASFVLALLAPSSAPAAFTRPFLRQLGGTPTGTGGSLVPFADNGGLAVDGSDDLWVGEPLEPNNGKQSDLLDEFSSTGVFLGPASGPAPEHSPEPLQLQHSIPPGFTAPDSLSVDDSTGDFYITGHVDFHGEGQETPPLVEVFDDTGTLLAPTALTDAVGSEGIDATVAVDNSTDPLDPSAGSVYVIADKQEPMIEKFNAITGEPVPFGEAAKCEKEGCKYIQGNSIYGYPGKEGSRTSHKFADAESFQVTVDNEGNIYIPENRYDEVNENNEQQEHFGAVLEYSPSGAFVRAFTGGETPAVGEDQGFGGDDGGVVMKGIAVDPVSRHVLVSVDGEQNGVAAGAIFEFEESSGRFAGEVTETSDGKRLLDAKPVVSGSPSLGEMTVDSNGDLYAVERVPQLEESGGIGGKIEQTVYYDDVIDAWGPGKALPDVKLDEASEREPTSALLSGSFDPEGQPPSECYFEVVPQSQFEASGFLDVTPEEKDHACVPAAGTIAQDRSFHPVEAHISALQPGTTYRFRLVAATAGVSGGGSESESLAFTALHSPRVESSEATSISSRFADLNAHIKPLGAATSYHFEYSSNGSDWIDTPVPDAQIGSGGPSGGMVVSVLQHIGPLQPNTSYTFRAVASNQVEGRIESTVGPELTFKTLPSTPEALPDDRSYELLTPSNKGSASDLFSLAPSEHNQFDNNDVGYPSESGEEFMLEAYLSAFGPFAASGSNIYTFQRTAEGWQTVSLASPQLGVQTVYEPVFDPQDFSQVALGDNVGSGGSVGGVHSLNLLGPPGGPYVQLHSEAISELVEKPATEIVGASHDLSRLFLASPDHNLVPEEEVKGPANSDALYEYSGGEFKLVSLNPKDEPFQCGATLGQVQNTGGTHNAVSAEGSKVFFTAPEPAPEVAETGARGCWNEHATPQINPPQLYMRAGGGTTEVSAPEAGWTPEGSVTPSQYVGASENGAKVFFVTATELTRDDAHIHDLELYEYDTEAPEGARLVRVSSGESHTADGHVDTVPAISADGSSVYFTAFGALAAGASELTPTSSGPINLYHYDTETAVTVYVATIDTRDYHNPAVGRGALNVGEPDEPGEGVEKALYPSANWYTTPDGRYLLFGSTSEVTPYSTAEPLNAEHPSNPYYDCGEDEEAAPFGHCEEVYRYDAELPVSEGKPGVANNPMCVSCDPSGAAPVSNATFATAVGGDADTAPPVRAISNDGAYVFFNSADPLVTQADNETQDVFEWEAQGTGGCAQTEGCLHLISPGDDPTASYFLGMSSYVASNGETVEAGNVFFGTHAKLVAQDTDEAGDLYDARIGGGFPVRGGKGPCEGNACENPAPAPIDATPGSLTFSGVGNTPGETKQMVAPKKATPTTAQRLASALKACRKKPKRKRAACEKRAHKKYLKSKISKKSSRRGK